MITVKEALDKCIVFFRERKMAGARKEAAIVIGDALGMKPLELYMQHDRPLTEKEVEKCREVIIRRVKGEPNQYIKGCVEFLNCVFSVDKRVLIPRMETEILVDKIIKELEEEELEGKALWDICTGSGCIGISLKKRFPELSVTLSDLSEDALEVAKENAERNGVEVRILKGDLLEPFKGEQADYVVSNPPYVREDEYQTLAVEVKHFEPKMALVPGESGLEFYQRFSSELPDYLNPGARVWMEIGMGQGKKVEAFFSEEIWEDVWFEQDWGRMDRFFYATLKDAL